MFHDSWAYKIIVDKRFGTIKKKLKLCKILSVKGLVEAIRTSCVGNHAIDVSNEKNLNFYDWKKYLLSFFVSSGVPRIKKDVLILKIKKLMIKSL